MKKRAGRSKGTPKKAESRKSSKRTAQDQPEKEEQKVKVEEATVKVEENAGAPIDTPVKTNEVQVEEEKAEDVEVEEVKGGVLRFPPQPENISSFDRDFSPDIYNPPLNGKGSGDGPGRSSSASPNLNSQSRRTASLTIDCSGGHHHHGSGDAPLSSDSGISLASPRSRKTPFERYSSASSLALRQRAMSECLPLKSPGLRSILKTPSEDDVSYGPQPRRKTVSICTEANRTVHFDKTCSIEEHHQHAAKNRKKREWKARKAAQAQKDAVKDQENG